MTKKTESSGAAALAEPESKRKTKLTNWDTFVKAGLGVTRIVCSPLPGHPADEACKTNLIPTSAAVVNHITSQHGGGFIFTITDTGKIWPGWKELADAGVEIQWIRDEVTDHRAYVNGREIRNLLKPRQGKFRGAYQAFHGQFLFNLSFEPVRPEGDDNDDADTES